MASGMENAAIYKYLAMSVYVGIRILEDKCIKVQRSEFELLTSSNPYYYNSKNSVRVHNDFAKDLHKELVLRPRNQPIELTYNHLKSLRILEHNYISLPMRPVIFLETNISEQLRAARNRAQNNLPMGEVLQKSIQQVSEILNILSTGQVNDIIDYSRKKEVEVTLAADIICQTKYRTFENEQICNSTAPCPSSAENPGKLRIGRCEYSISQYNNYTESTRPDIPIFQRILMTIDQQLMAMVCIRDELFSCRMEIDHNFTPKSDRYWHMLETIGNEYYWNNCFRRDVETMNQGL